MTNSTGELEVDPESCNLYHKIEVSYLNDKYLINMYFVKSLEANKWVMHYIVNAEVACCVLEFDENGLLINDLHNVKVCLDAAQQRNIIINLNAFNIPMACKKIASVCSGIDNGKIK